MKKIALKINVRWITLAMLCTAGFTLILGSALFVRQHFIPFSSPESAYKLVYGGETFVVVEGVESACVIGDKDAKYLNKSKNGWTVPIIKISVTKAIKYIDSATIYVTQYNFSNEHYVIVSDFENQVLDIDDNRGSKFYKIDHSENLDKLSNKTVRGYCAYINGLDSRYTITINGEEVVIVE